MRGGMPRNVEMVVGKLLFETAKFAGTRAKEGYDLLYAVGVGTAIGIGSNPDVRSSYELWKGKAKMSYGDKVTSRRLGKEPYLDEGTNYEPETYIPDKPSYRSSRSYSKYRFYFSNRRRKNATSTRRRGCGCESMLRRILGKSRFSKYRR